jgi:PAS domain S-box-containing protein
MAEHPHRKTFFLLSLSLSLVTALGAIVIKVIYDDDLRERLAETYYVISLAIIGCVLLVLAGYVWDRSINQRLRALRDSVPIDAQAPLDELNHDEIIGLARNIERMAQTLQKTEASYRGIVEDQVDLICRYRPDGKLTFVNNAYLLAWGRKRQELIGQNFPFLAPGAAIGDETYTFEREIELPDTNRRSIMWTQRPIRDDKGNTLEFQAVGHDITMRKEAEASLLRAKEAAEAADVAKSEFLAIVSHEISIPIKGVLNIAQTLAESNLSPEQREQVETIRMGGQMLEKLITDIIEFSKIDAGKITIKSSPFALHRIVDEVIASFQSKARASGLGLVAKIDPEVPAIVNGDDDRLRQILTHLVGNAVKFTERGTINLQLSCMRGEPVGMTDSRRALRLFFTLTDTGIGIAPEDLPDLFRPFGQSPESPEGRTGLGLILSKRLCELMGGSISIESKPGEGSIFRFSILTNYTKGGTAAPFPAHQG